MFDVKRVKSDFSAAAPQYDLHAALQKRVLEELASRAAPLLEAGASVLDAGCGTGRLKSLLPRQRLVQLDVSHAMCVTAMAHAPSINGSVEALPFADASFDGVISSLVLQWVPHWSQAMQEMRRVLKPGGALAVATFGPDTLKELKESFKAVDRYSHVSTFLPREAFREMRREIEYYPDLLSLMRHLKRIGARNKLLGRRKSLFTRTAMERLERRYQERFGSSEGLPVTWEILSIVERV
jgi:malonyl-CoA O-methyltransferase